MTFVCVTFWIDYGINHDLVGDWAEEVGGDFIVVGFVFRGFFGLIVVLSIDGVIIGRKV